MHQPDLSHNCIERGDCIRLLSRWPAGFARLVFADPPFNIGYRYHGYNDARSYREYVDWSRRWVAAAVRALAPDGSLFIAIGDDYAAELRLIGRELGLTLRNWIIWHYQFGQNMRDKFARAHTHILYFVRDSKRFVFHDGQVRFPSARHTEYGDRRANPLGRVPDDVWNEFPRVCGTFKERQGWHGCQMPEALLMRIVRVASDPGDVVLDPFVGSGTTVAAAVKLGRVGIGIDSSVEYAAAALKRLHAAEREAKAWREPGPDGWSEFERETLKQVYRETETGVASLVPNDAAMACVARALSARTGRGRGADVIREELLRLNSRNELPRFKNDRAFHPRQHRRGEHAGDRKLAASWFAGMPARLRRANELGRPAGKSERPRRRLPVTRGQPKDGDCPVFP